MFIIKGCAEKKQSLTKGIADVIYNLVLVASKEYEKKEELPPLFSMCSCRF
ncbi:hypothetical protein CALK_1657 [Chitinivibrio alkaliphilus ACht1]|uniref:Uncharacterized protein n=1 Tax=Chitinivibrio alkaliphilus ACht1 TaxID=1313304 RepID=U7D4L4_9BACT|nr:hypothetical protein CALK_1657 [Chitinivibrio alkaliphilus ACht1]